MNSELLVVETDGGAVAASGGVSAETWLRCKNIERRNRMQSENWVSIEVRVRESSVEFSLV